ncbi:L-histidine N(alpha)-methyltransferase [Chitinophaga sp. sic0106]|uniref:L-histidine N(alpha)-methyltransferase n=1 Tax=Chitinophaga sp. sic0106 TaxID=2854785 RepID=UPI001C46D84B|nr:L-histidine N(alpha)-methyltransferase [Chitinophaga sp. sic0106]MBV7532582.1 L-histidine N(alpha)-methyltransferase [Chitinophaga sp. sic0106]
MAHSTVISTPATVSRSRHTSTFYNDVVQGLRAQQKYLDPKYFYDAPGDVLFQKIMQCPEYYLTACEMEIMKEQSAAIAAAFDEHASDYDIVELGAGDASKSVHLLKQLLDNGVDYTYFPIDISGNVIQLLEESLPATLPGLQFHGLQGEYFEMLKVANDISPKRKIILFMGANIGNFTPFAARSFCQQLRRHLHPGDLLLTGFDLKKHPQLILHAYNDDAGITREFNFNLLRRINRELDANFDISQFEHYPTYDPQTGSCKSYLISLTQQQVRIGDNVIINFRENEPLYMEISQKYDPAEIDQLASLGGFTPVTRFSDHRNWFSDYLWQAI